MSDLFGTSGVRGIVNEDITPEFAIRFSKSLSSEFGSSGRVMIGRDTRISGDMLEDALVSGLVSGGLEVIKIGQVPTPVLAFATSESRADVGLMITASHNPPEYNGIKLFNSEGMPFSSDREESIESTYYSREFCQKDWDDIGNVSSADVLKSYLESIAKIIDIEGEYKVAVDCGCGPSGRTTPQLLESLGCDILTINSQLDGTFPGREAEPTEENLGDLKEIVRTSKADIGFAHDGDGDRVAVVDDKGRFVEMDKLLALMGRYSVKRCGGGVVTTVDASKIVDEEVSDAGGEVIRTKVGDVNVSREMHSNGMKFGGEPSGSWVIGDVHLASDGTLAAARILEILDGRRESLSELVDSIPIYPIMRDKVECSNERKDEVMREIENKVKSSFDGVQDVVTKDGIRLGLDGGDWVLIRPSGTEPYIRITAEANAQADSENLVVKAKEVLKSSI